MGGPLTLVTAYYKIYDTCKDSYVEQFMKLASRGYSIIVFADTDSLSNLEPVSTLSNVTIRTDVAFSDLAVVKLFPEGSTPLPGNRTVEKDTYKYIALMNSKTEFLKLAAETVNTDVAWVDFGICKLIKDTELMFKKLDRVSIPENKILIPGCHENSYKGPDSVYWRFCGSLLFASKSAAATLYEESLKSLKETNRLTWEVNVWAHVEQRVPTLFQWYAGDHNDTIFNFPTPKKVMVMIMIKNEEKIIKRCIDRALSIADAICISDTGSTDKTLEILNQYLPTLSIPTHVANHVWQDFGHNRTLSFRAAQEFTKTLSWDPDMTYALALDADMNFVVTPKFKRESLTANGYRIIQKNSHMEYYNTRFLRLGHPWKCSGVTHEYWDGSDTEQLETVYIDDIGDGGSKADKFQRDERLLRKGLADEPKNVRYMFYLAQTLKDLKKLDEAIEMYKQRIDAGGWYEEVWYSMYIISKLYFELNKLPEMEFWALKAYDYNKNRSENLYFLTRVFRQRSEHFKAWHYMRKGLAMKKPNDLLFVEADVYEHLFLYEKTVLNYYVNAHKPVENMIDLISYYNRYNTNVYSNLEHYVQAVQCKSVSNLHLPAIDDFVPTSTSFIRMDQGYRLNVRYVNYRIQGDGSYMMMVDGVLSRDNPVRTRNFTVLVDENFNLTGELEEMVPGFPALHRTRIQGLEDLRIYQDGALTKWVGTTMEYSYDGTIKQVMGIYNTETSQLTDPVSIRPFKTSDCEKNWIPLGNDEFIYAWYPFTLGKVDPITKALIVTSTQKTPQFFEHMRGSTNVVAYSNSLYAITHIVMYTMPRKYYHMVVRMSMDRKVEAYTLPFYFKKNSIEYSLGMDIRNNVLSAIVSQYDCDPIVVRIAWNTLKFYDISN